MKLLKEVLSIKSSVEYKCTAVKTYILLIITVKNSVKIKLIFLTLSLCYYFGLYIIKWRVDMFYI